MGQTGEPDKKEATAKRKSNKSSNQRVESSDQSGEGSSQVISLLQLTEILNNYTPQSWYRLFARYTLGLFLESFRYSWPVWNLKELINKNPDQENFGKEDIETALKKPSMFDLKLKQRETEIEKTSDIHQGSKKTHLNTDAVIKEVLQHFRKK